MGFNSVYRALEYIMELGPLVINDWFPVCLVGFCLFVFVVCYFCYLFFGLCDFCVVAYYY